MEREFYHFNNKKKHYFYFKGMREYNKAKMILIIDIDDTKLINSIPFVLVEKALRERAASPYYYNEGVDYFHFDGINKIAVVIGKTEAEVKISIPLQLIEMGVEDYKNAN